MILFKRVSFWLALLGVGAASYLVRVQGQRPPDPGPVSAPARSPYAATVAATGLIEASRENVRIASPKGGLVTRVLVRAGDGVKRGDPLFELDSREVVARISAQEAQEASIRAQAAMEEVQVADWTDQLQRFTRLEQDQVATQDEVKRRGFQLAGAKARVASNQAAAAAAAALVRQGRAELEILTVRAPRDGRLLQVTVRDGEYAAAAVTSETLMLLGDTDTLQVRAEVDEQNAVLVAKDRPAVASLKGHPELRMNLRFVRFEPYVVPKRSLSGDSLERVDTRVLQIVYEFERPSFPVYVGQQVDVFIERSAGTPVAVLR
jgi:RND family efflux transporter MFP subunit